MRKKENKSNNTLIYAILGGGIGFLIADYLKNEEIKKLKAKIASNPSDLTNILKESSGILDTVISIFKKK